MQKNLKIVEGSFGKIYIQDDIVKKTLKRTASKRDLIHAYREIFFSRHMKHPNLISLRDVQLRADTSSGKIGEISLVFNNCGTTLKAFRQLVTKTLPGVILKTIMFQVFRGLVHLHRNNIMHRDLHLENVLVNLKTFVVKIIDFGWAKDLNTDSEQTFMCHHRYFKAPEDLLRRNPAESRTINVTRKKKPSEPKLEKRECMSHVMKLTSPAVFKRPMSDVQMKMVIPGMNPDYVYNDYTFKADVFSAGQILFYLVTGEYFYKKSKYLRQIFNFKHVSNKEPNHSLEDLVEKYELFEVIRNIDEEKLSEAGKDLLMKCLKYRHERRLSALDALKHPFFSELNANVEKRISKYKELKTFDLDEEKSSYNDILERIKAVAVELENRI